MRGPNIISEKMTATGWLTTVVGPIAEEISARDRRIEELETELHAIKYEVMGGEDVPGSANMVTVDDVRKEMERLRAIERKCRT